MNRLKFFKTCGLGLVSLFSLPVSAGVSDKKEKNKVYREKFNLDRNLNRISRDQYDKLIKKDFSTY